MTAGGSKSYKRRRVGPKGAGVGGNAAAAGAGSGGRASPPTPPPGPYEGMTAEQALAKIASDADTLVPDQLYRLCGGLPRTELELMCAEAAECERALREEIRILEEEMERLGTEEGVGAVKKGAGGDEGNDGGGDEKGGGEVAGHKLDGGLSELTKKKSDASVAATKSSVLAWTSTASSATEQLPLDPSLPEVKPAIGDSSHFSTVNEMVASELTPPDRYFTVSALLGRLREPLDTPPPPNSALGPIRLSQRAAQYRKGLKKGASDAEKKEAERRFRERLMERQRALLALESNPVYTRKLADTAPLLACWKRISNHRSAAVFRKAVNPREAPGYTDRILFPIDLALIRKMISAGHIGSFRDLHRRIGLICHNCVKYNGRESDYGLVTREFESYADDSVIDAVAKVADVEAASMAKAAAAKAAATAAAKVASVSTASSTAVISRTMPLPGTQKVQRTSSSAAMTPPPFSMAGGVAAAAAPATSVRMALAPTMAAGSTPAPSPPSQPAGVPAGLAPAIAASDKKSGGAGVSKSATAAFPSNAGLKVAAKSEVAADSATTTAAVGSEPVAPSASQITAGNVNGDDASKKWGS